MSGFVIGKQLGKGFAGNVSRSQDTVIACFAAKGAEIPFGAPVILNADGTVSRYSKGDSAAKVIGFAVREVKQAKDDGGEAAYKAGEPVDVLLRGSVVVEKGKYLGEVKEVVADGITYLGCTSGQGQFIPGKPYGLGYDLLKK